MKKIRCTRDLMTAGDLALSPAVTSQSPQLIDLALASCEYYTPDDALVWAAKAEKSFSIQHLIEKHNADPTRWNSLAFRWAASCKDHHSLWTLAAHGADVSVLEHYLLSLAKAYPTGGQTWPYPHPAYATYVEQAISKYKHVAQQYEVRNHKVIRRSIC